MSGRRLSAEQVAELPRMRARGMRPSAIARALRVSQAAIDYRLKQLTNYALLDAAGVLHPLNAKVSGPVMLARLKHKISPRVHETVDDTGDRNGRAAEGRKPDVTSGAAASGKVPCECPPTVPVFIPAEKPLPDPLRAVVEPVRAPPAKAPDPSKRRAARSSIGDEDVVFDRVRKPVDMGRFRAALEAKAAQRAAVAPAMPIERATNREECRKCGVPGFKGCEHQLPYVAPGPETEPFNYRALFRPDERKFYGEEAKRRAAFGKVSAQ